MHRKELVQKLGGMGFFKYVDEAAKGKALETFEKYETVFSDESGRVFGADSEELAEGGVQEFIEVTIASFLNKAGVDLESLEVDQEFEIGGGYSLYLDGKEHVLYSKDELESENFWHLCTERAFKSINSLLERSGSEERVYYLYGGNDTQAVFLTPGMFTLISESDALPEREKPVDVGVFGDV